MFVKYQAGTGGLSKSDIISAIQNPFANMCVSRL